MAIGYYKDELRFVEGPPKLLELECPICLQVMLNDPHLVSCCGHHFCGPCIKEVQEAKQLCPLCKRRRYQAMFDKNIQRSINGLHVYCINNKEGCKWKGELKDLSSHLQHECQYVRVHCKHQHCTFVDQRYTVKTHERKHCPYRPYTCEHCGYKDSFGYITVIHYSSCYQYPVHCPNNCKQEKIPRYQLEDHLDTFCPFRLVECEFSWAGCEVKRRRHEIPRHCSENLQKHLSLVTKACKELKRENQLLNKENSEIKTYITIIQEELEMKYSDYKGSSICKDYGHSLIAACLCITILYLCLPIVFYIIMKIF